MAKTIAAVSKHILVKTLLVISFWMIREIQIPRWKHQSFFITNNYVKMIKTGKYFPRFTIVLWIVPDGYLLCFFILHTE